jgi:poly(3-hydroxybutyrate) depolymerase
MPLMAPIVAIVQQFVKVFRPDPKRLHVMGFSRGGYTGWRLACNDSQLFASVAIGGAGDNATLLTSPAPEATCFQNGQVPARAIDALILMGEADSHYANIVGIRNAAMATYGLTTANETLVGSSLGFFTHVRASKTGSATVEWFDHTYQVDPTGSLPTAKGHCIPGSTVPANAPLYAVACKPPTGFDWGAEVLTFFDAHHQP